MTGSDLFRGGFLIAVLVVIGLHQCFTQTVHVIVGQTHVFRYNHVPWILFIALSLMMAVFAEVARRFLKDRAATVICWLMIPVYGLLTIQLIYERVEINDEWLVHRREPPHQKYNVDIAWDTIRTATKINMEKPGIFVPNSYTVGYEVSLNDGTFLELPANTVLTSAQELIDTKLNEQRINWRTRVERMPR